MKTLIELYDERAIENVLGPEMFRPERIIYLCPTEIYHDRERQQKFKVFFCRHGWNPELIFLESSLFKADRILKQLLDIAAKYPDCALDIPGGTDAALFAGGMFAAKTGTPAFTYSRKQNRFYNISNARFAEDLPCTLSFQVEDFFLMAGGTMRKGRVDNAILVDYLEYFDPFFEVFLRYRRHWQDIINYIQTISPCAKGEIPPMQVQGKYTVKGERGGTNTANEAALREFQRIGFIHDLRIIVGESVAFRFKNETVRGWLRDVGSVLELFVYKACLDSGVFGNVINSAVVNWDDERGHGSVSNEIDVMAVRSVVPLFLSCKTSDVRTEAINELAVLRDRFGGKGAKAAIVTAEPCNAAARHRAAQLGIAIIDLEELKSEQLIHRIKVIMKLADAG